MSRRAPPPHRYIYVIGPPVGLQKVGIATDPKQRLATLQTACPFDLFLHIAIAAPFGEAHAVERRAHRLLAKVCVRNEWFETTPAEAIAAVQSAATLKATTKSPGHAVPAEWRITRAERRPMAPPDLGPLVAYGRQFRPDAGFHQAAVPAPLPLFEYTRSPKAMIDEQRLVEKVLGELVRRIGGQ